MLQLNVYDAVNRVNSMRTIIDAIDEDKSIDEYKAFVYQMCIEYTDILNAAKVKI